jgi:hypothetical protein
MGGHPVVFTHVHGTLFFGHTRHLGDQLLTCASSKYLFLSIRLGVGCGCDLLPCYDGNRCRGAGLDHAAWLPLSP